MSNPTIQADLTPRHKPDIPAVWYNNLPPGKQDELKRLLVEASPVFDVLRNMIKNMYVEAQSVAPTNYENPNWAYLQAHKNGRMQVLQDLYRLLP